MISWWIPYTVLCIPDTIPTARIHTHWIWRENKQSPTGIVLVLSLFREKCLGFISDGFHPQGLLWWSLAKKEYRIWGVIPFLGGDAQHETVWCILRTYQYVLFYSSIRVLVPYFSTSYYWILVHLPWVFLRRELNVSWIVNFLNNNCKWCVQAFFVFFVYLLLFHHNNPQF